MKSIGLTMMSMRYRSSLGCRPECANFSGRMLVTTRAATSAVLSLPASEGLSRRYNSPQRDVVGPRKIADPIEHMVIPASSGLDFIDLVGLDDSTVWNCLQDAVTYRVLVGRYPAKESSCSAPRIESFNLKQLKSYRDNVTRNLAPTVARGFANAARAAGHIMSATPSTAAPSVAVHKPGQQTELPRASQATTTPPPPSLRTQTDIKAMDHLQTPLPPSTGSVVRSAVTTATATPDLASAGSYVSQRTHLDSSIAPGVVRRQQGQPVQPVVQSADAAMVVATVISVPAAAAAVRCREIVSALTDITTTTSSSSFEVAEVGADSAVSASMYVNGGRRRGSRGASRGRLVAVAGRHVNGAAASTGPAWI